MGWIWPAGCRWSSVVVCVTDNKVGKEVEYTVCQMVSVKEKYKAERRIGSMGEGTGLANLDNGGRESVTEMGTFE